MLVTFVPFFRIAFLPCAFALAGLFLPTPLSAADDTWSKLNSFEFNEAQRNFQKDKSREGRFGEAVALLNIQPRSAQNIDQALAIFTGLAAENSRDDIGALSSYYQGRVLHLHYDAPRKEKALAAYRQTLALRSGNPLAENAAASIVNLEVYDREKGTDPVKILQNLESLLAELQNDIGRREFHLAMGSAYLEFTPAGNKKALEAGVAHLIAADKIGVTRWQAEVNVWVGIAEASRTLGDKKTALEYYNKFLGKYQRDRRTHLITERVAALQKGTK